MGNGLAAVPFSHGRKFLLPLLQGRGDWTRNMPNAREGSSIIERNSKEITKTSKIKERHWIQCKWRDLLTYGKQITSTLYDRPCLCNNSRYKILSLLSEWCYLRMFSFLPVRKTIVYRTTVMYFADFLRFTHVVTVVVLHHHLIVKRRSTKKTGDKEEEDRRRYFFILRHR